MVTSINEHQGEDGRPLGVEVKFRKDRAALSDPRRTVRYLMEEGALTLLPCTEVVGSCAEGILTILWKAAGTDAQAVSAAGLIEEAFRRYDASSKTVRNTLARLIAERRIVRPHRGHYALAPAELQRRGTPLSPLREDIGPEASQGQGSGNVPANVPGTKPGQTANVPMSQCPTPLGHTENLVIERVLEEECPVKGKGGVNDGQGTDPAWDDPRWKGGPPPPAAG